MTADDGSQKVVCILGMHRSGTSALTRIINLLGVDLGPHEALALEPAEDNTKGHWEHKEIALINEEILSAYGGSWHEPPVPPTEWQTSTVLDDLRARAEKLIHEQFENVSLWGWKDPRTCLTLPFWQQFVSNPYYILCLRNPLDVASSLARRNQFLPEKSFKLWTTYLCAAFKYTEGKPRLVVFYEDLIDDSGGELNRLAQFLGETKLVGDMNLQLKVQLFIEKGLQHHQSSELDTTFNSTAECTAKALYLSQRILTRLNASDSIESTVLAALKTLDPDLADHSYKSDQRMRLATLRSLTTKILRTGEIDDWVSRRVAEKIRALTSRKDLAEENARELSQQLHDRTLELERIKTTAGFRLLSRGWRIKHKYFPRSDS
ncbi:MAG TPA: sulfotransferase domain-containing protein [Pyrinomonadaceae bacterium]|nr:sulfotransferase domain-containing protein [Pyrinomonadaceae bacterium]